MRLQSPRSICRSSCAETPLSPLPKSSPRFRERVDSAKCARRFQKPDWLDYTAAPDAWVPATLEDLIEDAEHEKRTAVRSAEAVDEYVRRVVAELAGSPVKT